MCHFVYNEFIKSPKKWSDQNQTSWTGSYSCIVNTVLVSKFPDVNIMALMSSFPGAGDVWFSLRNTTYQNNSIVMLEDISKGDDDALLCKTNYSACCGRSGMMPALGNWYFPNGSRVPSTDRQRDIYRTRGQMVVRMNRRRGGVEGIYRCEIPDAMNVTQTIYIGVYSASTGEWYVYYSTIIILQAYFGEKSTVNDNSYSNVN